jgi:hypothetical protein
MGIVKHGSGEILSEPEQPEPDQPESSTEDDED